MSCSLHISGKSKMLKKINGIYSAKHISIPNRSIDSFILMYLKIMVQLMSYTIFQLNISSGSGDKVDFSGLPIFSNRGHFWFPTSLNFTILKPCSLVMLHMKSENHGCSDFRE